MRVIHYINKQTGEEGIFSSLSSFLRIRPDKKAERYAIERALSRNKTAYNTPQERIKRFPVQK